MSLLVSAIRLLPSCLHCPFCAQALRETCLPMLLGPCSCIEDRISPGVRGEQDHIHGQNEEDLGSQPKGSPSKISSRRNARYAKWAVQEYGTEARSQNPHSNRWIHNLVSILGNQVRAFAPFYTSLLEWKHRNTDPRGSILIVRVDINATNFRAKGFLDGFHTYIVYVGHMACVWAAFSLS